MKISEEKQIALYIAVLFVIAALAIGSMVIPNMIEESKLPVTYTNF